MTHKLSLFKNPIFLFLVSILLAASMWFYVEKILVPYQEAYAISHGIPRGNLSDLYPRWLGAKELLLHGRDPYSLEITKEIQAGYYGRKLEPTHAEDPKDEQRFAYPVYVVFLLAPLVKLPFYIVHGGFRWFLVALILFTTILWTRVLRWQLSMSATLTLLVLVMGSFPAAQSILLQQLSILEGVFLAAAFFLLLENKFLFAGIFLALATIKPHLSVLVILWLMLWTFGNWRERKKLFFGFSISLAVLFSAGEWVLPGWFSKFIDAVKAYRHYTGGTSAADLLLGSFWGKMLALLILFALAICCWQTRKRKQDDSIFILISFALLAAPLIIFPIFARYNQIFLIPGVFFLTKYAHLWLSRSFLKRFVGVGAALTILWPWIITFMMLAGCFFMPLDRMKNFWGAPLCSILLMPFAILLMLGLCWPTLRDDSKRTDVS